MSIRCSLNLHSWRFFGVTERHERFIDDYGRARVEWTFTDLYRCSRCKKTQERHERNAYTPAEIKENPQLKNS